MYTCSWWLLPKMWDLHIDEEYMDNVLGAGQSEAAKDEQRSRPHELPCAISDQPPTRCRRSRLEVVCSTYEYSDCTSSVLTTVADSRGAAGAISDAPPCTYLAYIRGQSLPLPKRRRACRLSPSLPQVKDRSEVPHSGHNVFYLFLMPVCSTRETPCSIV